MKKSSPVSRSGRFLGDLGADVARFTESVSFDWRLWRHDILGSIAHATMLRKIGVLSKEEQMAIVKGLDNIGREIADGKFQWQPELEDVHMNIEAELTRRVPAGAKLHTARSRNDQVALDMRMWLRDEIFELAQDIRLLQHTLVELGEQNADLLIPGYTHLQRAQPVYFAHHLLAYVEMLARDRERLKDCFKRVNVCPLGSGAIAGSTLPLDRELVARLLGFVDVKDRPQLTRNSMDAVSDRDFAIEFCGIAALLGVHLSRLAEDVILWASAEFNFIKIADAYTTGSSLMPQKKNPDIAELARGKSGRVIGNLVSLLTLLKGLPMTYNRDLQEDKQRLFDSADTARTTVRLITAMMENTSVNAAECANAASDPALLATDLSDYLVRKGLPFRQAHHIVGAVVALAEQRGKPLDRLTLEELQSVDKHFAGDALKVFDLKHAMAQRNILGAPGTKEVRKQLARWRKNLFGTNMDAPASGLLTDLLKQVSRSFYLTMRVLPGAIRPQISVAYLLARTTDTVADTQIVPLTERLQALQALRERILGGSTVPLNFGELARHQSSPAEWSLLQRIEEPLALLEEFSTEDRHRIREVLSVITAGQESDLNRFADASSERIVSLNTDGELDDYTYRVAGCVGEFWTKMCRAHLFSNAPLDDDFLVANGVRFGKGLQLVNILRDLPRDLRQGRCYLPGDRLWAIGLTPLDLLEPVSGRKLRPLYDAYLEQAEAHLAAGWIYTNALPRTNPRVRLACAWPLLIGISTVEKLRANNLLAPELHVKITRSEVRQIVVRTVLCYPWPQAWTRLFPRRGTRF